MADTIVYAAKGHGAIVSGSNGNKRQELAPGDFALIPAYAEHQEINESDEDVVWIITRGGRNPIGTSDDVFARCVVQSTYMTVALHTARQV